MEQSIAEECLATGQLPHLKLKIQERKIKKKREKTFSCEVYGSAFARRDHLKKHMRIHEERNYSLVLYVDLHFPRVPV